jgi:hypothetical protein
MRGFSILLVPFAIAFAIDAASAAQADDCKICRESRQACVKNHSRDACRTEYDICMKHCRRQ